MSLALLVVVGLFLPLFPFSMVFNEIFDRVRVPWLRVLMLLIWPQIGIGIAYTYGVDIPAWVVIWALLTALLYGFRALVLREVSLWVSFLATSAWSVLWVVLASDVSSAKMVYYALGFSAPLALLVLLGVELERRFGAAYTGLYNGIAESLPRLSGVIVIVVLAAIATPLFPGFSAMLNAVLAASSQSFGAAIIVSLVWLVWGWMGARLLQGLIIGEAKESVVNDLNLGRTWVYVFMLGALTIAGIYMIGGLS